MSNELIGPISSMISRLKENDDFCCNLNQLISDKIEETAWSDMDQIKENVIEMAKSIYR